MSNTVRKNFVLNADIAQQLEEITKENNQSMTSIVEEMVEHRYRSIKVRKRLVAFEKIQEIAKTTGKGLFVGKSIQSIKAEMDV